MHLTKNASKNSGFTLVELIVVITILAILATIAFISYQGYTTDARNAKRKSDLSDIMHVISAKRAQTQIPLSSVTDTNGTVKNDLANATATIAGANSVSGTDYNAGAVNYTALAIKVSDFQDPDALTPYRIGWTTRKGGQFELAATLAGDQKQAYVIGTYSPRTTNATVTTTAGSDAKTLVVAANDGAKFFVGDSITDGAATPITTTIAAISADLTKITTASALTVGTIKLSAPEVGGLVGSGQTATAGPTAITDGLTTSLPY